MELDILYTTTVPYQAMALEIDNRELRMSHVSA